MKTKQLFLVRIACLILSPIIHESCCASDESTFLEAWGDRKTSATTSSSSAPFAAIEETVHSHESVQLRRSKNLNLVLPSIFSREEEVPMMSRLPKGVERQEAAGSVTVLPYIPPLQLSKASTDVLPSSSQGFSSGAPSPISPAGLSSKRLMSFEELSYLIAVRDMCVPEFSGNLLEDIKRHQSILIRGSADRREQEFLAFCRSPFLEFYQEARHNKRILLTQHVQSLLPVFLYVVKGAVDFIENYEQKIIKHRNADKPISLLGLKTSVSLIGDIHQFFCTHGSRMSHFYTAVLNVASESDRDVFEAKAHEHTQELSCASAFVSLAFIQRFYLEAPGYLYSLKAAYANCCLATPVVEEQEAVPALMSVTSSRTRASSSPRGKFVSVVMSDGKGDPNVRKAPECVKSFKLTPRVIKEDSLPCIVHADFEEESHPSKVFSDLSSSRLSGDEGSRVFSVRTSDSMVDVMEFLSTSAPKPAQEAVPVSLENTSQPKKKSYFFGRHFKKK